MSFRKSRALTSNRKRLRSARWEISTASKSIALASLSSGFATRHNKNPKRHNRSVIVALLFLPLFFAFLWPMKITVLGSGSTGNAVLIVAGNTRVLVDAGLSAKEIARRLSLVGEDAQRLDAVLVTHEHGDHAGGLRVLLNSVDCPVYISAKTLDAYLSERFNLTSEEPRRRAKAMHDRVEQIESSKDFKI